MEAGATRAATAGSDKSTAPISADWGSYATVYAVDAATGRLLWKFDPQTWKHYPLKMLFSFAAMSFSPMSGFVYVPYMQVGVRLSKGAAPRHGAVTVGTVSIEDVETDPEDGKGALLAWDPVRQHQAWKVPLATIWNGGTLATAGNLVFQGAADGYFSAYDAATGRQLWRFYAGLGINAAPISYLAAGRQYVSVLVGYGPEEDQAAIQIPH
jgi:glucose dehydrogenase